MLAKFTFPKSRRLTRSSEFERVKKEGNAQHGKLLVVSALKAEVDSPGRAGFVTSRRIGRAAVRNLVRRRLREIVRKHQHEIGAGWWVVTIARPAAAGATFVELEDAWLRLAKRASILAL